MLISFRTSLVVVLVSNNMSSANDLTQGEDTNNLDSSDKELDRVLLGVGLESLNVVSWSLESVKATSLEGLENSLELSTRRRSKSFLNVNLLSKLSNNLGPEDSLGDNS